MTAVGSVGARRLARVDGLGGIFPDDLGWHVEWWIGADDRWHIPANETAVRQRWVDNAPVVETAMRVPGGDALHRAYGAPDAGGVVVVEIENASPAPFVAAFVVRGIRQVALDDATVIVDNRPALVSTRRPSRWAVGPGGSTQMQVVTGQASEGDLPPRRDRAARLEAAFLHPVAHRATLRVAVVLGQGDEQIDVPGLATAQEAARGWGTMLQRGMRVELPDEQLAGAVQRGRAAVLLESSVRRPRGEVFAALEDWGFDAEASDTWERLPGRARRVASRRPGAPSSWPEVDARREGDPAELLVTLRNGLVHESGDGVVTLLSGMPPEWRGQSLEVHDAPTRLGPVSFVLRWHGERPALLWEAPDGARLRAPSLDPEWSTAEPSGEALLATAPS